MNYPLISEYVEAIKAAEDNFDQLKHLRPVLDWDGLPVMTSGNFAVVFKMKDEQTGKLYAVKCFTKEQEGREEAYRLIDDELKRVDSPYLTSICYLEKELFVDTSQSTETEFPVLLMDWVEGKTLDKYLRENLDDKYALEMLAYRFSQLAQWLIPQPFAHGDLKPDNILVQDDGSLVLVDYDGMYVPAMKGQKARELGSPDFRHPQRTEDDFDEHIDDFPLVSFLLSLKAISINSHWLEEYGAPDRLLMSANVYRELEKCLFLKEQAPFDNTALNRIVALFLLSFTKSINTSLYLQLLYIIDNEEYPIITNEEEIANAWKDEKGVRYSQDRKRLLKSPINDWIKGDYYIQSETKVICNSALCGCWGFEKAFLPNGLIKIGDHAFYTCLSLKSIEIPNSVSDIGKWSFYHCSLVSLSIPNSVRSIGEWAFAGCEELKCLNLSNGISKLENGVFSGCYELEEVVIPNSVRAIGKNAFSYCKKLKIVYLPNGIREFGEKPFIGCENLLSIVVPKGTKWWYDHLLPDCIDKIVESKPKELNLSTKITSTDWTNRWEDEDGAAYSSDRKRLLGFGSYDYDAEIYKIKEGILVICELAFNNFEDDNHFLKGVYIPQSVIAIGGGAFAGCLDFSIKCDSPFFVVEDGALYDRNYSRLIANTNPTEIIRIESNVKTIGAYSLSHCNAKNIQLPSNLRSIEELSFCCSEIEFIIVPLSVTEIGFRAFMLCENLTDVCLLNSNTIVDKTAFDDCSNLHHIFVRTNRINYYKNLFPQYADIFVGIGKDVDTSNINIEDIAKEIYELGKAHWEGKGVKKNLNEALRLYELASELGSSLANIEQKKWRNYWFDEDKALYSKDRKIIYGLCSYYIDEYQILDGTESIDDGAFCDLGSEIDFSYLDIIEIPSSVTSIGHNPFNKYLSKIICKSPHFEVDGDSIFTKGKERLIQCFAKTETFVIPKEVLFIDNHAFYGCKSNKIIIPDSVRQMGINPFIEMETDDKILEVISLSPKFTIVNNALYEDNTKLLSYWGKDDSFTVPNGIKVIGEYAFFASKLNTIILTESIESIGDCAFGSCFSLTQVLAPANAAEKFQKIMVGYQDMIRIVDE